MHAYDRSEGVRRRESSITRVVGPVPILGHDRSQQHGCQFGALILKMFIEVKQGFITCSAREREACSAITSSSAAAGKVIGV
jgi:hypothetical protein